MRTGYTRDGRRVQIPLVPGLCRPQGSSLNKRYHGKTSLLEREKTGRDTLGHLPLRGSKLQSRPSTAVSRAATSPGDGDNDPAWIRRDRHVLRFFGFVEEKTGATFRSSATHIIRKVIVYFFLADGTMKIVEPRNENSGIQCGVMVSRQKLTKTGRPILRVAQQDDDESEAFKPEEDLYIGASITVCARQIHLVDCDQWTRDYYDQELCIQLDEPFDYPTDPLAQELSMHSSRAKATKPKHDSRKQFLENEKKVLRFEAVWDDQKLYGEKRRFQLSYYLENDSVELKEIRTASSGRSDTARLLKPRQLPKQGCPGEFVRPADLVCGEYVHVYGRDMLLVECDDFTRDYYLNLNGQSQQNARHLLGNEEEPAQVPEPPHVGYRFGSEEDSLQSHYQLNPSAPKRDVGKMRRLDRKVLRFRAKFQSPQSEHDRLRRFLVAYHLEDDTLEIFEAAQRNATGQSGTGSTRFLARQRYRNMGADGRGGGAAGRRARYFKPADFFLGAVIALEYSPHQKLELLEADAFTLKHCEVTNADGFPYSNAQAVVGKLAGALSRNQPDFDLRGFFAEADTARARAGSNGHRTISEQALQERIEELGLVRLNRQEHTTLARNYYQPQRQQGLGFGGEHHQPQRQGGSGGSGSGEVLYHDLCDDVARHAAQMLGAEGAAMSASGGEDSALEAALHKIRCCRSEPHSMRKTLRQRDRNGRGVVPLDGFMRELQRRGLLGDEEETLSQEEAYLVFDQAAALEPVQAYDGRGGGGGADGDVASLDALCDLIYQMPAANGAAGGGQEDEDGEYGFYDRRGQRPEPPPQKNFVSRPGGRRSMEAWGDGAAADDAGVGESEALDFFRQYFQGKKYELHSELRDRARRGQVNERNFVDALMAVKPNLSDDKKLMLSMHFFPNAGDTIDYRRLMAKALA